MPRPHETSRHRQFSRPQPPLPHPSWSRTGEFGEYTLTVSTVSADEFWNRLGL